MLSQLNDLPVLNSNTLGLYDVVTSNWNIHFIQHLADYHSINLRGF